VSCGGAAAGRAASVNLAGQAVIQGTVFKDGAPVARGYVRLLDPSGEFAGEVPTGTSGDFRFYAGPGQWTVRALAAGAAPAQSTVEAAVGEVTEIELTLSEGNR
jgi:Protein of unknown function (DUF1416)